MQRRKCDFRLLKADLENGPEWLLGEQAILCSRYLEVSRGGGRGRGGGGCLWVFTTVHYNYAHVFSLVCLHSLQGFLLFHPPLSHVLGWLTGTCKTWRISLTSRSTLQTTVKTMHRACIACNFPVPCLFEGFSLLDCTHFGPFCPSVLPYWVVYLVS